MKKITAIMLLISLMASMLVGCQAASDNKINGNENDTENNENINGEYRTAVTASSDDVDVGGASVEYVFYDYEKYTNVKDIDRTVKLSVNGEEKEFICTPAEATFVGNNYYPTFQHGDIRLNQKGMIEGYINKESLKEIQDYDKYTSVWCGEEKAIQVAKDFVSQIVDPSDYEISVEKWDKNAQCYAVFFTKYVDGIKTTEELRVEVTYKGNVSFYTADMLCQFSGEEKNPFDMKKAEEAAHARVKEIYGKKMEESDRVELDEEYRLTKLKDGSLALFYTASIDMIKIDSHGGENYTGAMIEMVIMK